MPLFPVSPVGGSPGKMDSTPLFWSNASILLSFQQRHYKNNAFFAPLLLAYRLFGQSGRINGETVFFGYDLWDANKMKSCLCDRSQAVDNFYSGTSDTYRGPYAFADTDSYGFNCSLGR